MNIQTILEGAGAIAILISTFLFGQSGAIRVWIMGRMQRERAAHMKEQEEVQQSDLIIKQYFALVETLSGQVKDLRDANATNEQQQAKETQLLREYIRTLEARVGELERKLADKDIELNRKDIENAKLKSLLYDSEQSKKNASS